jgi:uncharacterized protein
VRNLGYYEFIHRNTYTIFSQFDFVMPVSNSSPLIHLSRLGKLGYARQVFAFIMIPPAVRSETIEKGKSEGYADALVLEKLENDGWLRTTKLSRNSLRIARELSEIVGRGEAEAVALALEKKERLFMDDLKGRRTAELYRIETTTTLGIIFELLLKRAVEKSDYTRNVKNYAERGWISGDVVEEFIQRGADIS